MREGTVRISRAAVLGAGTMGSRIAALLAGADIPCFLLDIVPPEIDQKDTEKGLTRQSPGFRNRLARAGLDGAVMSGPAAFFSPADARLVTPGNLEDHLEWLTDADWVIEAAPEDLEVKAGLLKRIDGALKAGAIVSTTTSGLSIERMSQALSDARRPCFLGTHFFNPPRHVRLLEVVPGRSTDPGVADFVAGFCERRLGKSTVVARDAPGFIANRVMARALLAAAGAMVDGGYTIEEADAITGAPMGRPASATFRTADMMGLEALARLAWNVRDSAQDASEKEAFTLLPFMDRMVQAGLLGDRAGKGFYRRAAGPAGDRAEALDWGSLEYVPVQGAGLPLLDELKGVGDASAKMRRLVYSDDRAGRFAWKSLKALLLYCASRAPEMADSIVAIDRAMRWGFNWDLGPFEAWDAIGVRESVEKMRAEGESIPRSVEQMLAGGREKFYRPRDGRRASFDLARAGYVDIEEGPCIILLPSPAEQERVVRSNAGARLLDLGEGVLCLEFRTPGNAIDEDVVGMVHLALADLEAGFEGMVIGSQGAGFSAGLDVRKVHALAAGGDWERLEQAVRSFQDACMAIKYSPKPVVAAPYGRALGAGCELCLAAGAVRAHAGVRMGLADMGLGLIPGGGGTKEMLLRATEHFPPATPSAVPGGGRPDLIPYVALAFQTIATGQTSTSAREARGLGFMRPGDPITMNPDHLLHDARQTALSLVREGYLPPRPHDEIRVIGRSGRAMLELMVFLLRDAGFITDTDGHLAGRLAYVISGGDVDLNTLVTERYLLDLEREVFLSLAGEEKTRARLKSMAETGRLLHN